MNDPGFVIWFTGLSGAGKSTIAAELEREFQRRYLNYEILDGDVVRTHLSKGLGFSKQDRDTNIRRIGWVAHTLAKHGCITVCAAISPYRDIRDEVRRDTARFVEVFVDAPLAVCESRDVKGLYKKARAGEIKEFTGISAPYEAPKSPELTIRTSQQSVEQSALQILAYLEQRGVVPRA
jgi:adenylylsulfate kinase